MLLEWRFLAPPEAEVIGCVPNCSTIAIVERGNICRSEKQNEGKPGKTF